MKKILFLKPRTTLQIVVTTLFAIALTAGIVVATTTIGSNITTGGNVAITGTLTASTTTITSTDTPGGFVVKNANATPILEIDTNNSRSSSTAFFVHQAGKATTPRFNASSTAVSIGDGSPIAKVLFGSCEINFPSITASTTGYANCTATGLAATDVVTVTPVSTSSSLVFASASSTTNTLYVSMYNTGWKDSGAPSGNVDDGPNTWYWMAVR